MTELDQLWRYAKQATASISGEADRRAAREELYEHAVTRYEGAIASGASPSDALNETLARLGDPAEYATELRRANRPAMSVRNLALLIAAAVLVAVAVIALVFWIFWANGAYRTY